MGRCCTYAWTSNDRDLALGSYNTEEAIGNLVHGIFNALFRDIVAVVGDVGIFLVEAKEVAFQAYVVQILVVDAGNGLEGWAGRRG
eukprot:scaffold94077_cov49-Attheya_sp.AAC.3